MATSPFFDESLEQSQVKTRIVTKYFWAWAKVMLAKSREGKLAYIDLFAGPGRYKDGTKSTPLMILERAIHDPEMRTALVAILNDVNSDHSHSLEELIKSLPGIETLSSSPQVANFEVGTEIVKEFEEMRLVPTLFFIDPWGYKGLSLRLINSVLKNWGSECILFFNYNRINMGLANQAVQDHMDVPFGKDRADGLRRTIKGMTPNERELTIIEALSNALFELGGKFVLPFKFFNPNGTRVSHHLIFVSKNVLGYKIMKDVMAKESSEEIQGVPTFEYNKASKRQPILFQLCTPLDDLGEMLLAEFAGRTCPWVDVYESHHIGKPFIESNYRKVLLNLEAENKITLQPPAEKRRKYKGEPSLGKAIVTFPRREE